MAGHAQLKFVMTECSKTQIRLTGLIYYWHKIKQLHLTILTGKIARNFTFVGIQIVA